ncbi:SixA phosphatase family protein [Streptosporangium carneum]|uniref:SixA phosphatase family protein n=1 Tax=Streptosporangium carneum TaxID=47481 RepID=UPI0022F2C299|nr:histidine phosphatase family protein [Streptosporangium carneum]
MNDQVDGEAGGEVSDRAGDRAGDGGRVTTRTLIVLRHAKAAHTPGLADRERPLTERGRRDARRIGETLTGLDLRPDLVLCSPSIRTRQTAELALPGADITFEPAIYEAYPDELLTLVRRSDPEVRTLILVGHNPGVHELVQDLTTREGDPGFPPGAFAVIETDAEWAELDAGRGVVRWSPKEH